MALSDPLGAAHVGMRHLASLDLLANDALICIVDNIMESFQFSPHFFILWDNIYVCIIVCSRLESIANISESKRAS